jgi:hypothetical protein
MSNEMDVVTLKQICEELNIKPAAARRKLRGKLGKSEGDFRWEFTPEEAIKVKDILTAVKAPASAEDDSE